MKMDKNVHTFIGCDNGYDESGIVIFGAPFDGTTSYRPGTRFASSAMRNESFGMETYSPYQDKDLLDIPVFDGGDLELAFGNVEKALLDIQRFEEKLLSDEKIPCMIGGEHLVTLGAVRAVSEKYKNLKIVHLDAHADLRAEYLGEALSHATVMRRCWEIVGDNSIFQFGIRSGEREEFTFAKRHTSLHKFNFTGIDSVKDRVEDDPVYLSVDLDVLDPSVFRGTGTPEAGGVTYTELLGALEAASLLNIVACDVNELCPVYDQSGASTALACTFLRELLLRISR